MLLFDASVKRVVDVIKTTHSAGMLKQDGVLRQNGMMPTKKPKPPTRVFIEWRENGQYFGANYSQTDVPRVFAMIVSKRAAGANIPAVYVDDEEVEITSE